MEPFILKSLRTRTDTVVVASFYSRKTKTTKMTPTQFWQSLVKLNYLFINMKRKSSFAAVRKIKLRTNENQLIK